MNCKYHQNINATNTCNVCGEWICENCVLELDNKLYCKDCLKEKYRQENNKTNIATLNNDFITTSTYSSKNPLLYMLNLIPGCLPLYLGDKKGLKYLILFFIFLGLNFETLAMITFIYSFYQGLNIKRKVEKIQYMEKNDLIITNYKDLYINTNPNKLWFIISSFIPGCTYLYLGNSKKGLGLLSLFFIFLWLNFEIFAIILFLYSLCDSFYIKNNILKNKFLKNIDEN